ncbi:MAG: hypothetical protein WCP81_04750 [Actinomycetes bacterium]|jgi:hypothetical protein
MRTTSDQTTSQNPSPNTAFAPLTGTWFSRWGKSAYELSTGVDYAQAVRMATEWATRDLDANDAVEVEIDVIPVGDEWVVDVVAFEVNDVVRPIGSRRARITSAGRLVA